MFCKQCGNEIPEGGKFCPECGTPVSQKAPTAKKRPNPTVSEQTARPLMENPYQPHRTPAPIAPVKVSEPTIDEDDEPALDIPEEASAPVRTPETVPSETTVSENDSSEIDLADTIPPMPKPRPKKRVRPVALEEAAAEEESVLSEEIDMLSDLPEKQPPFGADKPTIAPHGTRRANTLIPKRIVPTEDEELENFFNDEADIDELDEEFSEDQTFWERNMRSLITAGLLLLTVLILIFYLTLTSSGKVFMAGLGLTQDAHAYKLLGDQYTQNDQLKSASDAYYLALKYDADNYEYAIQSAKAFYAVQDKELAARACLLAIDLDSSKKEPYTLLAEMFPSGARSAAIASILEEGAAKFSDPTLAQ